MKKRSSNRPRRTYAGSSRSGLLAVATTKTGAFLSAIHERIEPPIRAETPLSLEPSPPEPASNFSISSTQRTQGAIASAMLRAREIFPSDSPTYLSKMFEALSERSGSFQSVACSRHQRFTTPWNTHHEQPLWWVLFVIKCTLCTFNQSLRFFIPPMLSIESLVSMNSRTPVLLIICAFCSLRTSTSSSIMRVLGGFEKLISAKIRRNAVSASCQVRPAAARTILSKTSS